MVVASAMQGLCGIACTVSSVVHESPSSSSSAVLLKPFVTRPGIDVSIGTNNNNFFCTETFWRFDVGRGGMTMASLTAAAGSKLAATTPPPLLLHQIGTTTLGSRRRYNLITAAAASIAEARPLFRVLRLGTGPRSIPEQQQALLPCSLLRKKSSSRCFFARNKAIAEDDDDLVQVVNDGGGPPTPVNSCFLLTSKDAVQKLLLWSRQFFTATVVEMLLLLWRSCSQVLLYPFLNLRLLVCDNGSAQWQPSCSTEEPHNEKSEKKSDACNQLGHMKNGRGNWWLGVHAISFCRNQEPLGQFWRDGMCHGMAKWQQLEWRFGCSGIPHLCPKCAVLLFHIFVLDLPFVDLPACSIAFRMELVEVVSSWDRWLLRWTKEMREFIDSKIWCQVFVHNCLMGVWMMQGQLSDNRNSSISHCSIPWDKQTTGYGPGWASSLHLYSSAVGLIHPPFVCIFFSTMFHESESMDFSLPHIMILFNVSVSWVIGTRVCVSVH